MLKTRHLKTRNFGFHFLLNLITSVSFPTFLFRFFFCCLAQHCDVLIALIPINGQLKEKKMPRFDFQSASNRNWPQKALFAFDLFYFAQKTNLNRFFVLFWIALLYRPFSLHLASNKTGRRKKAITRSRQVTS